VNDYKLTPGIYVGAEEIEMDDVPFEEKMGELMNILQEQFTESNRLQEKILRNLEGIL
jgi:type I restriction enzyme M protein